MMRMFSIHKGRNTIFVTDNICGHKTLLLTLPHDKSWDDVKEYFLKLGATNEALSVCGLKLEETGNATLSVEIP